MLRMGPYPAYLKRRVASNTGHLSNSQTALFLHQALTARTRLIVLAHLSRTNNIPELALQTIYSGLSSRYDLHRELRLVAAPALAAGETLSLT